MAKFGEGDERWLVQDLGEGGRNVGQWHWSEKDITAWAKERVKELLVGTKLGGGQDDAFSAEITGLDAWDGDVVLNIRKAKLIAAYEVDLSLGWRGERRAGHGSAEVAAMADGKLQVPYLSEENHDEDPELRVTASRAGADADAIRAFVAERGRPIAHAALRKLVAEIHAGGPQQGSAGDTAAPPAGVAAAGMAATQPQAAPAAAADRPPKKQQPKAPESYTSLRLQETFQAAPRDLYECFTDARRVMAFTQAPAAVEPVVGGRLAMYDGAVTCTFTDLTPGKEIRMDWRFNTWADGVVSKVVMTFAEPSGGTCLVTVQHTGIPEVDRFENEGVLAVVERGWQQQIFHRIKAIFGYGI